MENNEFFEFKELWETYSDVINPSIKLSDKAIAVIFEKLSTYNLCEISVALDKVVGRGVFSLNIADVLNELKGGNNIDLKEKGIIAYNLVNQVVIDKGIYNSYIFEDVAIGATLNNLGWDLDTFNTLPDNDFNRNLFVEIYVNHVKNNNDVITEFKGECSSGCIVICNRKTKHNGLVFQKINTDQRDQLIYENDMKLLKDIAETQFSIPQLPEEKKADTSVPAPIKDQMDVLKKTFDSFGI